MSGPPATESAVAQPGGGSLRAALRTAVRATQRRSFPFVYAGTYAAAALLVQLAFFRIADLDLETDFFGEMLPSAIKLAAGEFSVRNYPYKGPFYSIVLVVVRAVLRDWYWSAVAINALATGAALCLTYVLVRRSSGHRTALLCTVLGSIVVEVCVQSHRASTDPLFLALALGSTAACVLGTTAWTRGTLAGALAALAVLTRYNGVFLVPAALVSIVWIDPRGSSWGQRSRVACAFTVAFLAVVSPWLLACHHETGRWLITRNAQNVAVGLYGWGTDQETFRDAGIAAVFRHDPLHVVRSLSRNLVRHLVLDQRLLLGIALAPIVLSGLFLRLAMPPSRSASVFYVYAAMYALTLAPLFYAPRFFLYLVPAYVAAALSGWAEFHRRALAPRLAPASLRALVGLGTAVAIALVVAQLVAVWRVESRIHAHRPLYLRDAAQAVQRHAGHDPRATIMARKGHIAALAGLRYQPFPRSITSIDSLFAFAARHRVDYLFFGLMEFRLEPALQFLSIQDTVPGMQEVYRSRESRVFAFDSLVVRRGVSVADRERVLLANVAVVERQREPAYLEFALTVLGQHYAAVGRLDLAESSLRRAMESAGRVSASTAADPGWERRLVVVRQSLAIVLEARGRPLEAIPLLEANLERYTRSGNASGLAETRRLLDSCRADSVPSH